MAMDASPRVGMAAEMKTMQPLRNPITMKRGRTHFIMIEATNLPIANSACATARRLDPSAVVMPGLASVAKCMKKPAMATCEPT